MDNVAKLPPKKPSTKDVIHEFLKRYNNVQNEIATLKDSEKELFKEYEDSLDTKVLKKAISIAKAMQKINEKDTFDSYFDILENESL